jgi:Effector Associated Constant Component 1
MSAYTFSSGSQDGPSDLDLRDLTEWFDGRDALAGTVELRIKSPALGEMGGMADAVVVTAAGIPVAKAFFAWLETRVRNRRISFTLRREFDGQSIVVNLDHGQDAAVVMAGLKDFFSTKPDE